MFIDTQYSKAQLEMTFSRANIEVARVSSFLMLLKNQYLATSCEELTHWKRP